jgi:hypothetical protein
VGYAFKTGTNSTPKLIMRHVLAAQVSHQQHAAHSRALASLPATLLDCGHACAPANTQVYAEGDSSFDPGLYVCGWLKRGPSGG